MSLPQQTRLNIDSILKAVTDDPHGVPGLFFKAVDKFGNVLYADSAGVKTLGDASTQITEHTLLRIASCTKLVTSIAAMQLVEQGRIALDDPAPIAKYLPEVCAAKVIVQSSPDEVVTKPRENEITLRMLMTHTGGSTVAFWNKHAWNNMLCRTKAGYKAPEGVPDVLDMLLGYEPGTEWHYAFGLDYTGILIERLTGMGLNEYFAKFIFEPLGIRDTKFEQEVPISQRATIHQKDEDGNISITDLIDKSFIPTYLAGGHGLFSTVSDYMEILSCVLNNGIAKNGQRLLKEETIGMMFTPQLDEGVAKYLEGGMMTFMPSISFEWDFCPGVKKNWGLSFLINEESLPSRRSANSATWAGITNCYWTIDRTKGVALFIVSQMLPFADPKVLKAFDEVEKEVYEGLETQN